jgi:hypothetical protein
MSFLDSKEQVIDLVLTKHGKKMIADGLFSPTYYNFLDDDIIYNAAKIGVTETQNESEPRIVEQTPKNSFIINSDHLSLDKQSSWQPTPTLQSIFQNSFGLSDSEIGSQVAPRFTYMALRNAISASAESVTVGSGSYQIPQLDFELNAFVIRETLPDDLYEVAIQAQQSDGTVELYDPARGFDSRSKIVKVFDDKTIVKIDRGQTIGLLLESGASKMNDTYEIECYTVEIEQSFIVNGTKLTKPSQLKKLNPFAQWGEIDNADAMVYYLDVQTEENLVMEKTQGFSPASGLYDNLPESEKC